MGESAGSEMIDTELGDAEMLECSECAFPLESYWIDMSVYRYDRGNVSFAIARRPRTIELEPTLDEELAKARARYPKYSLLFHEKSEEPVSGSIHIGHTYVSNDQMRVDLMVFFTLDDTHFVAHCSGPNDELAMCQLTMDSFVDSFTLREDIE